MCFDCEKMKNELQLDNLVLDCGNGCKNVAEENQKAEVLGSNSTKLLCCNCPGWTQSMTQIDGAQMFCATRGMKYTGDVFKYCPWCGARRQEAT